MSSDTGGAVASFCVRAARGAREDPQGEGRRRLSRGLSGGFRQHEQQQERGEKSRGKKAATPRALGDAGCEGHGVRCRARPALGVTSPARRLVSRNTFRGTRDAAADPRRVVFSERTTRNEEYVE